MVIQKPKSNKSLHFVKDRKKSYVYVRDGDKEIGIIMWHYLRKRWVFKKDYDY